MNDQMGKVSIILINPVSQGAGIAQSAWVDVREFEGNISIIQQAGAVTGTLTGTLQDATDGAGGGAAAFVPLEGVFTVVSAANNIQQRTISANTCRGWIKYFGTVGTGPVLVSVCLQAEPKYKG